jgi:hypothetical protein
MAFAGRALIAREILKYIEFRLIKAEGAIVTALIGADLSGHRVKVTGLRELTRDLGGARSEFGKDLGKGLRAVAEPIRADWAADEQRFGAFTATGLRTVVRQRGVAIEQTRRKTTGMRPDFGRAQQRLGDAALDRNVGNIEAGVEHAIDGALRKHAL